MWTVQAWAEQASTAGPTMYVQWTVPGAHRQAGKATQVVSGTGAGLRMSGQVVSGTGAGGQSHRGRPAHVHAAHAKARSHACTPDSSGQAPAHRHGGRNTYTHHTHTIINIGHGGSSFRDSEAA